MRAVLQRLTSKSLSSPRISIFKAELPLEILGGLGAFEVGFENPSPIFAEAEDHDGDVVVLRGVRAERVEILLQLLQHHAGLSTGVFSQDR